MNKKGPKIAYNMEADREHVISDIRACLLSIQGSIEVTELERDYRTLIGSPIPFRRLEYPTLEKFLQSIPGLHFSTNSYGALMIDAVPTKETKHLADLVSRQKSTQKRKIPRNNKKIHASSRRPAPSNWKSRTNVPKPAPPFSFSNRVKPSSGIKQQKKLLSGSPLREGLQSNVNEIQKPGPPHYEVPPRFLKGQENDISRMRPLEIPPTLLPPITVVSPQPLASLKPVVSYIDVDPSSYRSNKKTKSVQSAITVESDVHTVGNLAVKEKLFKFCSFHNLQKPVFQLVSRKPKGERVLFTCIVKIGEYTYSSYPHERHLEKEAIDIASNHAMTELTKMFEDPGVTYPETTDNLLITKRVCEIVADHPTGLWTKQLPVDYTERYGETLPSHWQDIVSACPTISLEQGHGNNTMIVPNLYLNLGETCVDISKPMKTVSLISAINTLPASDMWDVYVTLAISICEVWIRLIGPEYSDKLEHLAAAMDSFYADRNSSVKNFEVDAHYVAKVDEGWHRVQLISIEEKSVNVFFIDHGAEDLVPFSDIHYLIDDFRYLPPQAVLCSLNGLDDFENYPNGQTLLTETIVNKVLVAQVVTLPSEENLCVSINLYDTSTEEDINLNEQLVEKFLEGANMIILKEGEVLKDVFVTYVDINGDIYIQIQSDSYNFLTQLLDTVIKSGFTDEYFVSSGKIDPDKIYLARFSEDNIWYRAKVIKSLPENNKVHVHFMDFGNEDIVNVDEMLDLLKMNEALARYPPQAMKVHLHNIPETSFSENMVDRINELIGENAVLLKVISVEENKVPEVEIFKRISENKQLVSLNSTLALDPEFMMPKQELSIHTSISKGKMKAKRLYSIPTTSCTNQGNNISSSKGNQQLPHPEIPNIKRFFDVYVTLCCNPSNFVVQPLQTRGQLDKMMKELQDTYNSTNHTPKTSDTISVGNLYAALLADKIWYRVSVLHKFNETVSVYLSDFGEVTAVTVQDLRALEDKFKELPYQAIKAKLSGIVAIHNDWSVEDTIRFHSLAVDKSFVSVIEDIFYESDGSTVLGLTLIDTSDPNQDIYLDKILVDENRARFLSEDK